MCMLCAGYVPYRKNWWWWWCCCCCWCWCWWWRRPWLSGSATQSAHLTHLWSPLQSVVELHIETLQFRHIPGTKLTHDRSPVRKGSCPRPTTSKSLVEPSNLFSYKEYVRAPGDFWEPLGGRLLGPLGSRFGSSVSSMFQHHRNASLLESGPKILW